VAYQIGLFEVQRAAEAIEIGRAATRAALPDLLAAMRRKDRESRPARWWNRRGTLASEAVAA
jgi:hypothetical protein